MSFFHSLVQTNGLEIYKYQPLWKYMLNVEDFNNLLLEFKFSHFDDIDPRDATLYYAEWWKRTYNGGNPSKELIFNSLQGDIINTSSPDKFFEIAKEGARRLRIKWIRKQNTLYFKTLLQQGGLPISHISENHGVYQKFLLAVLDEQPESIEDFSYQPQIVNILPKTSQNEIIFENCFEIVKSILNNDQIYDDLFTSDDALKNITDKLKVRSKNLIRKFRFNKPKNYWIINIEKNNIHLNIGLANKYDAESLKNILGFDAVEREYQFYLDDELICTFRKMINGSYKTDWLYRRKYDWNEEINIPYTYVIVDGKKHEVKDFIQAIPNLDEPSLWVKNYEKEWQMIKGNGTSHKYAAVLFPNTWCSELAPKRITIYGKNLSLLIFEGEAKVSFEEETRKYQSEVKSFDWTIVNQKPYYMLKANMSVVKNKPNIIVYDENNKILRDDNYTVQIKRHRSLDLWQKLEEVKFLPLGCIDLKIERNGLIAYDKFYNIGNLQVNYLNKSINYAEVTLNNKNNFEFGLDDSPIMDIEKQTNSFALKVDIKYLKIPTSIKGYVGLWHQKKLYFDLISPFEGMSIIDKNGRIIPADEPLSLSNLYGLRILSTPNKDTFLKIENSIKSDVVITKKIKESSQPIISYKDEITRLFLLADAMAHENRVYLELNEQMNVKTYKVAGFSHTLDINEQFKNKVCLSSSDSKLDLFAVPLNCSSENITVIALDEEDGIYKLPETEITDQFIIISSIENNYQLMPRFVKTKEDTGEWDKVARIECYHSELLETTFEEETWKRLLSYFSICTEFNIPFSTFDQIRAISRSSEIAAKAFFFLGVNQFEQGNYIIDIIPELEKDLGFCFHWINKNDWNSALNEINLLFKEKYFKELIELISNYMNENEMPELFRYITENRVKVDRINNFEINSLRATLGDRVLRELPSHIPNITNNYNIQIGKHKRVMLLLHSPIAVAESINNIQKNKSIWAGDESRNIVRRCIQYSQYIAPEFYKKTLLHALINN